MTRRWAVVVLSASCCSLGLGQDGAAPSVALQIKEMLSRPGHSPTTEEIQAVEMAPGVTDPGLARDAEPLLVKALSAPDAAVRKYGLAALVGMQVLPDAGGTDGTQGSKTKAATGSAEATGPASYKGEVAKALLPAVPTIGARLTDEDVENRTLAATVLGGFGADASPEVFSPLLSYLKRDDAVGAVGLAVVSALLQLGPVSEATAAAISSYLRRQDQKSYDKTELVEAIAGKPNQSRAVNGAIMGYLDSDDGTLRARVILSLPLMDMSADVFEEMKTRVAALAAGGQDSLPVVNAAKAVSVCWTMVRMASGCPAY